MTLRWGQRLVNTAEGVTSAMLRNIGLRALQASTDGVLGMLTGSPGASSITPLSGIIGGNSFQPVLSSGLIVTIKPGRAVYVRSELDSYTPSSDPHGIDVIPLLLNSSTTVTHGAHDATHPRWDIISMKWATTDADSGSRYVRTAGPGSQAVQSLNESRTWGPAFTITAGTPGASPSLPTAPADKIVIAHVYVPAVSGAVTVRDVRVMSRIGDGWSDGPKSPAYGQAFVGSGCAATAPGGMSVTIGAGSAHDGLAARPVQATTVTVSTADATNPRIDLVYLDGGQVLYLAGTAAATPAAPALPSGNWGDSQPLCEISVPALDAAIGSDQLTDVRRLRPYTMPDHIEYNPTVYARVTVDEQIDIGEPTEDYRRISIQAVDQEGAEIAGVVYFRVSTWAATLEEIENTHGSATAIFNFDVTPIGQQIVLGSGPTSAILATDEDGFVEFDIVDNGAANLCYVKVNPIDWGDATDDTATLTSEATYKPGGETLRVIGFR